MTHIKLVILYCDECGKSTQNESINRRWDFHNVRDAREAMKTDGWAYRGGKDLCPAHARRR